MSKHTSPAVFTPRPSPLAPRPSRAFTLVEMIVVTGIIAVLAALIFPVTAGIKKAQNLKRAQAEIMAVAHAIDGYKDKLGHFPPDNTSADSLRCAHSQLFYELLGTAVQANGNFQTLDGSVSISPGDVSKAFFPPSETGGFINCTRGGGDEAQPAQRFLADLKAGQYLDNIPVNGINCRLLGGFFDGPNAVTDPASGRKFTPLWYNYTSPTNGTAPYDLCLDIQIGNKLFRVSNWSTKPQALN